MGLLPSITICSPSYRAALHSYNCFICFSGCSCTPLYLQHLVYQVRTITSFIRPAMSLWQPTDDRKLQPWTSKSTGTRNNTSDWGLMFIRLGRTLFLFADWSIHGNTGTALISDVCKSKPGSLLENGQTTLCLWAQWLWSGIIYLSCLSDFICRLSLCFSHAYLSWKTRLNYSTYTCRQRLLFHINEDQSSAWNIYEKRANRNISVDNPTELFRLFTSIFPPSRQMCSHFLQLCFS